MPDGTGDDVVNPTIADLQQLAWDVAYIRNKLTLDDVSKTFIWRKSGEQYQMMLGLIALNAGNLLAGFRNVAALIQSGADGSAPAVENFGQSSWTTAQLQTMYKDLVVIGSKIMTGKRTATMRMGALANSSVEWTVGDIASSSSSYRLAIHTLAGLVAAGQG